MPIPESERYYWLSIESSERAWRYMSFPAFAKLLRTEKLLFRKVSDFPDPYEGSVPHALPEIRQRDAEALSISPNRYEEVYSTINEHARKCCYANCWHLNNNESEAMWKKYGDKGIAVIANIDDIIPSFEDQDKFLLARPVRYFNFFKSYDELSGDERARLEGIAGEIFDEYAALNFLKRKSFRFENEFRILHPKLSYFPAEEYDDRDYNIVIDGDEDMYPAFTHDSGQPVCVDFTEVPDDPVKEIKTDLPRLVDEIRIAPGAGDWFIETVCDAVDKLADDQITSDFVQRSVTDIHDPQR